MSEASNKTINEFYGSLIHNLKSNFKPGSEKLIIRYNTRGLSWQIMVDESIAITQGYSGSLIKFLNEWLTFEVKSVMSGSIIIEANISGSNLMDLLKVMLLINSDTPEFYCAKNEGLVGSKCKEQCQTCELHTVI